MRVEWQTAIELRMHVQDCFHYEVTFKFRATYMIQQ